MNGDVKIIVQIPEVKYTITLCRSLTVIMGDSGIGNFQREKRIISDKEV
jgi:hypothetical protein